MNNLKSKNEHATADDYELLVLMTWKDDPDYGIESEKAFATFYEKHRYYLMCVIRKKCESLTYSNKEEIINELFNDVFRRIFEKAETIRNSMEKHQYKDEEEFRKILRAYLGKMALYEFLRYMKGESAYQKNYERMDLKDFPEPSVNPDYDEEDPDQPDDKSEMAKLAENALMQLKPMEKDVLLTKMMYHQEGKDLPDEVIKDICKRYAITPGHMRTILARAIEKFTRIISGKTGLEPVKKVKNRDDTRISANMWQENI